MISHTWQLNRKELWQFVGLPLLVVAGFAGLMHLGATLGLLPSPRPTLDVDRTLLVHQVEASRARHDAPVLLIGDSSCLMDVSASQLGRQLNEKVLNLGTLSYLDLRAYRKLLTEYLAANPGQLRRVVLLMHPEALRRVAPEEYHVRLLDCLLQGKDPVPANSLHQRLLHWLGLDIFRNRVFARLVPTPLPGAYGRYYGFSAEFERYLAQHQGSAVEPDRKPFQGNAEYRLAQQMEKPSREFRQALPANVELCVGITPVPAGFAGRDYPAVRERMLQQWSEWLGADVVLRELPATLPDRWFANTTHLNERGAAIYTARLAEALRQQRPASEAEAKSKSEN